MLERGLVGTMLSRHLPRETLVIGGLGSAGRAWREARSAHATYYASDPMGTGLAMSLGLALAQPTRPIFYIGGDGDLVMNLGCLLTVVGAGAQNLKIAILDNGRYETGGGQPLAAAGSYSLSGLASQAGFPYSMSIEWPESLETEIKNFISQPGLAFAAFRVALEAAPYGPPPRWSQAEERAFFMRRLAGDT